MSGTTLSSRKVAYGSKTPYSNSFYYSPDDITGYTLYVNSSEKIKSTGNTISLYVESKITT